MELSGPYNRDEHARFQVDLPKDDYNFFRSLNPSIGVMQTTVNILLVKLQTLLKHHGITNVTQCREFCDLVTNVRLEDGREPTSIIPSAASDVTTVTTVTNSRTTTRSTTPGTLPEASSPDVSGRKTRTSRKNP